MRKHPPQKSKQEEGFILISLYLMLIPLLLYAGTLVAQGIAESRVTQRSQASMQALYLAEAGADQALVQLKSNFNWSEGFADTALGEAGNYTVSIDAVGSRRVVTSTGDVPLSGGTVQRAVEVILESDIPPEFYDDNVIWASQNVDFKGNSYTVVGNVIHGDSDPQGDLGDVQGTVAYDPSVNPLPRLLFQDLYNLATAQGNIYDEERLANGHDVFPDSFWYREPETNGPEDLGEPNVNYITTDLILNGNIGTIGGFFVVVGNVLTDPNATEDTTINGNGQIAGCIYTTGDFRINGGGNGLNVDGTIWAGDEARLNGSCALTYNAEYMDAIEALNLNPDVQVVSWQETEVP